MNKLVAIFAILSACAVHAQLPPFGTSTLLPVNPTSADNLKLSMADRTCGGFTPYLANSYRVSMSQNNVTVTLGEKKSSLIPLCLSAPREEIDLAHGRAHDPTAPRWIPG